MSTENNCTFIGRISSDIDVSQVGQGTNAFNKAKFSMAVRRKLSKNEKQQKSQGQQVKEAYFMNCEATGATADLIANPAYFQKGSPIAITAHYDEFTYNDAQGVKKYGHKFIVEGVAFVPQNKNQNGQGGQAPQQQYQAPQQQYQQNQSVGQNINNNAYEVDANEIPF